MNHALHPMLAYSSRSHPAPAAARSATALSLSLMLSVSAVALTAAGISGQALAGGPPAVNQLPTGGVVAAGSVGISRSGNQMDVTQTTGRAVVNWESFNVGSAATVNFRQPDSGSAILNRVADPNPSQIYGRIQANGQVFLTNPNGVYFAPGSSADVGGLVATTHAIGDADFMSGKSTFNRNGAVGKVVNEGELKASLGGYIALLAPEVRNNGVIVARMGTVALAAGEAYTLRFTGDHTLADLQVTPATVKALVRNRHAVRAPGGLIILSAQAVNQLRGSVVNSGQLEASGLVDNGGTIRLSASGGIRHSGEITADAAPGSRGNGGSVTLIADLKAKDSRTRVKGSISARGGDAGGGGGFIETSGGKIRIDDRAKIDTRAPRGKAGQWLIDPDGFTIASSGGDITGAALATNLASGNVSILSTGGSGSDGDINVNDTVTWSANKLTLTATNDVNINAVMTANNTASLDLEPGSGKVNIGFNSDGTFKGRVDFFQADGTTARSGTGFLTISNTAFTVITTLGANQNSATGTDLQGIDGAPGDNYALGADIDASATSGWDSGAGFKPIAANIGFTGIFDGLGHAVNGLTINRSSSTSVGMFSYGKGGTVRNVGIVGGSITGGDKTGALMGETSGTGNVIYNVFSSAAVSGGNSTGGLIGYHYGGTLTKSYATGAVSGGNYVGGLVGRAESPTVSWVYSTGAVSGGGYVGGLMGKQSGGTISDVYASGAVTATGAKVGGLIGANAGTAVSRGLAANTINGTGAQIGALVGVNTSGSVANSFYDSTKAGSRTGFGDSTADATGVAVGKTTTQLHDIATYQAASWTISVDTSLSSVYATQGFLMGADGAWAIGNLPVYIRLVPGGSTYGDTPSFTYAIYDAGSGGNLLSDAAASGTAVWSTPLSGSSSAGSYSETYVSGVTLGRTGYTLSAGSAADWTISPRSITVQANNQSRSYGGSNPTSGGATVVSGSLVNGDTLGSVALSSSAGGSTAAGSSVELTAGSLTLSSGSASNYAITYSSGGTLTIDKASLTVTANDVSKTYNGLAYSGGGGVSYSGFANGEGASVLGGSLSYGGTSQGAVNAGSYAITPGGLSADNYNITYASGTLTVNKASLTVTAADFTKTYDGQTFSGGAGVSYSGFINGESSSVLGGSLSYGGTGQGAVNAGSYTITAGGLTADNYNITYNSGALTVGKAALSVTAGDVSKTYNGLAYSGGGGVSYAGFVNGESSSVLGGSLSYGGTGQGAVNAGSYTITAGGLSADNYNITYNSGALTIGKAPLTVTAGDVSKTYNGLAYSGGAGVSYSGFVNGESSSVLGGSLSYGGSGQGAVNAGGYAITPGGLSADNYNITYNSGTLTVGKALLTATPDSKSRLFGASNPTFTYVLSGFVNGESSAGANISGSLLLTSSANAATPVGSAAITAAGNTLSAPNYAFTVGDGVLTILPAPPITTTTTQTTTQTTTTGINTSLSTSGTSTNPATAAALINSFSGSTEGTAGVSGVTALGTTTSGTATGGGSAPTGAAAITAAISVDLLKTASTGVNGVVTVTVPQEILAQSSGFSFKLPDQMTGGASSGGGVTVTATTAEGSPLPNWLRFVPDSKTFVAANVPDGGLPISVAVFINGQRTDMTIAGRG